MATTKKYLDETGLARLLTKLRANIMHTASDCSASTNPKDVAGASAVKELNSNLTDISLRYDSVSGKPQWKERGADTWQNFSSKVLLGQYVGNASIDISNYPNATVNDFIVEMVSNGSASVGEFGFNSPDTVSYASGDANTNYSKVISDNILNVSFTLTVIARGRTWGGGWNGRSASGDITFNVWFSPQ